MNSAVSKLKFRILSFITSTADLTARAQGETLLLDIPIIFMFRYDCITEINNVLYTSYLNFSFSVCIDTTDCKSQSLAKPWVIPRVFVMRKDTYL
jgi:hypothetical protein